MSEAAQARQDFGGLTTHEDKPLSISKNPRVFGLPPGEGIIYLFHKNSGGMFTQINRGCVIVDLLAEVVNEYLQWLGVGSRQAFPTPTIPNYVVG